VIYAAAAGTLTDQVAVPFTSADVALSVSVPIATDTLTPASVPVLPAMANPAAFSAMLTVSSPEIVSTLSASVPAAFTVTVTLAVASS